MTSRFPELVDVFQQVFDDDELIVTKETTAKDVDGWDSMMHVTLMISIEKAFGIRFSSSEVASMKCVGDLADLIEARATRV
jgi:acyl carrier protein